MVFTHTNNELNLLSKTLFSFNKEFENTIKLSKLPVTSFDKVDNLLKNYNENTRVSTEKLNKLAERKTTDTFTAFTQQLNGKEATMEDYQKFLSLSANGFNGVSQAIKKFNEMSAQGISQQKSYAEAIGTSNFKLGNYLTNLNGSKASMSGYAKTLIGATAKTIGLTAASTALNMVLSLGVSVLIQELVSGVDYLIHRNENLIESANELTDAYKEQASTLQNNIKSLNDQKDEFEKLSDGVDAYGKNISLSADEYNRYKNIVSEILGYSPELISGYDEEGNAIARKNDLLEKSIKLMQEERKEKLKEQTSDDNTKTIAKGAIAEYNEAFNKRDKLRKAENIVYSDFSSVNGRDSHSGSNLTMQHLQSVLPSITGEIYDPSTMDFDEYLSRHKDIVTKNYDILRKEMSKPLLTEGGTIWGLSEEDADKFIVWMKDSYDAINDVIKASHGMTDQFQLYAQTADGYDELSDSQKNFVTEYVNALSLLDKETGKKLSKDELIQKGKDLVNFVEDLSSNAGLKEKINNLFSLDKDNLSAFDFEKQANDILSQIQNSLGLDDNFIKNIKIALGFEFLSYGSTRIETLVNGVKDILQDEFDDKAESLMISDLEIAFDKLEVPEGTLLTWDELISRIEAYKSAAEDIAFSVFSNIDLGERLIYATEQFNDGKMSHMDYFESLQSEIGSVDFSNYTDSIEEANSLSQQFFTDSIQQVSSGLSDLINKFDKGKISVSEYLDGYTSIADTVNSLTDSLQENSQAWNNNGESIDSELSNSLDEVQNNLSNGNMA